MKRTHSFLRRLASMGLAVLGAIHALPANAQTAPGAIPLPVSETALVGRFAHGPMDWPIAVDHVQFAAEFASTNPTNWPAEMQARQFFAHGGTTLRVVRVADLGSLSEALRGDAARLTGVHALTPLSDLRILIAPELTRVAPSDFGELLATCRAVLERPRAFLILDPPPGLADASAMIEWVQDRVPADTGWAAVYFPYLEATVDGARVRLGASGGMAALYARKDGLSGIWSSPAGASLPLLADSIFPVLSTTEAELLNQNHVCSIRDFAGIGIAPWGVRTLDRVNFDDRFIAPARTRAWIKATLERDVAFAAFEENDEILWATIRTRANSFLFSLYQQGAFAGARPAEAYFVRCDASTTTAADVAAHRVNLLYGLATLRPAEFATTLIAAPTWDEGRVPPSISLHWRRWGSELQLAYATVPGFQFGLESSSEMPGGFWHETLLSHGGDGAWRRAIIPLTERQGYLRLRVSLQPALP